MDRRELLGVIGALGAGLTIKSSSATAADHVAMDPDRFLAPVANFHLHFCGIHIAKKNPKFQIVAQHYCGPCGEQMHQCLLVDSLEKNARLLGVEYIISDQMYGQLRPDEKKYWHPHTYEVMAGGLIAPSMSQDDESTFMKALLTTWGKTWHTWPDPNTDVPLGEPLLMWSLGGDGQEDQKVILERDKQFGVSTQEIRRRRIAAIGYNVPQVPLPQSLETVGRQWTASGPDRPRSVGN